MKNKKPIDWWDYVRNEELKPALEFFPEEKNIKILEIGGGNGYQAKKISEIGYNVISIDISPKYPQYFPVQKIDLITKSFKSQTFDLIFTSHVLPHLENLDVTLIEIRRLVKKNGFVIHILPTPSVSLVTNFWHYLFIPKYFWRSLSKRLIQNGNTEQKNEDKTKSYVSETNQVKLKQLFLHPLGNNPSFVHEFYYFSKFYWKNVFTNSGFKIISVKRGPDLTSGYGIFKMKFLKTRRFLGKFFSTTHCFILQPN